MLLILLDIILSPKNVHNYTQDLSCIEIIYNNVKKLFISRFMLRSVHVFIQIIDLILNDLIEGSKQTAAAVTKATTITNESKKTFHPIIFERELLILFESFFM